MKSTLWAIAVGLLCASCSSNTPEPSLNDTPAFKPREAAYVLKQGQALITGEAFIIGRNGKPVYAAGETIRLVPATAYARARFRILYQGRKFIPANRIPRVTPAPEYSKYTRTTVSNARGKFEFDNVAAGDYFITAQKIIAQPGKFTSLGGAMYATVRITGQERFPVKVIVAGK
jgi:hypothetical protein